jgi:hypothetical protein
LALIFFGKVKMPIWLALAPAGIAVALPFIGPLFDRLGVAASDIDLGGGDACGCRGDGIKLCHKPFLRRERCWDTNCATFRDIPSRKRGRYWYSCRP